MTNKVKIKISHSYCGDFEFSIDGHPLHFLKEVSFKIGLNDEGLTVVKFEVIADVEFEGEFKNLKIIDIDKVMGSEE